MTAAARADFRRGACPGLSTPMQTGDGLLARLMPTGTIPLDAMAGLCAAASKYGNRIIEVTSRGSIQVRGLTGNSAPAFADAVAALGIPAQDGVPVIADPLAGLDPRQVIDAGALAGELRAALVGQSFVARLSPKISISIDGGGGLHLDSLPADIRLRAVAAPEGVRLHVSAGGDAASATPLGTIAPADGIDTVARLLRDVAARGPDARARDAIQTGPRNASRPAPRGPAEPIGRHPLRRGLAIGVGFPFGHVDATTLDALLSVARTAGASGLRASPGRALLIVGVAPDLAAAVADGAGRLGFIVDANDPRRRVVACSGAPICAAGEIPARALAPAIAEAAARLLDPGEVIHVSGCAKGCAHHGRAALTAIGRDGACDLLVGSTPMGSCACNLLARRLAELAQRRQREPRHG